MTDDIMTPEMRDARYVMHPLTDARANLQSGPLIIDRGEGIHVYDLAGNRYIEAMAGLWSVGLGFSEPRLVAAATRQMERLPYYHPFSQKGHGPMVDLAERLVTMAPVPMSKAFFTNSGSEANDTVIKMLWYRANALGQTQRKKIISRQRAYHGITIAAASLTGIPANHTGFDLPLPGFLHLTAPHYRRFARPGESEEDFATRLAGELEELILREGPETIAAFFGEPVMGAGGVIVPPRTYWEKIQAVLERYDIMLVADEVICGFGRTGRMFGCETYGIRPDVMVLSKQLSSSYLPISAILLNGRMFEPIADLTHSIGTFGHGFTGGGHPVAAAVAVETLRIIDERGLVARAAEAGAWMQECLATLADHPLVDEVRGVGLMAAVELTPARLADPAAWPTGALGRRAAQLLQQQGVISRAMGDALAFCPPMIIDREGIDAIVAALRTTLDLCLKEATP
ncbi:aminotransferase [Gluconacetobacter tumulicola]|uniref:Aminotransferase class III-fold pyridoxal phosphate-dependent enzyme n=1 Tax=Gluconacetobacter tumulicola TaxID=1017177 RepID=A0A7W4JFX8_9PROT|nr:aminotransferase [Gluconacetobacter tumulicola]MBB2180556.1 aminotransferase class III-fold pyridoxal phosphate-dependent enzyme [Gluconacetobacter tumulicola]